MTTRKRRKKTGPRLPEFLRPLFWDYRFGSLSWEQDRDLVVDRVLAAGGVDALKWLLKKMGGEALAAWLRLRHGAGLAPQQLSFWEAVLELSHGEVTSWIAGPQRQVWDRRCHS